MHGNGLGECVTGTPSAGRSPTVLCRSHARFYRKRGFLADRPRQRWMPSACGLRGVRPSGAAGCGHGWSDAALSVAELVEACLLFSSRPGGAKVAGGPAPPPNVCRTPSSRSKAVGAFRAGPQRCRKVYAATAGSVPGTLPRDGYSLRRRVHGRCQPRITRASCGRDQRGPRSCPEPPGIANEGGAPRPPM